MKTTHGSTIFASEVSHMILTPDTGSEGCPLVVLLHGMGQSASAFAQRTSQALGSGSGKRVLLYPDGPLPLEVTRRGTRAEGRAWYIYTGDQTAFLESLALTESFLLQLIDQVLASTGADPSRVWLAGFSQGGYAAGIMGLHHMERFAGIISLASRIKAEILDGSPAPANAPSFHAIHGTGDPVVSPSAAQASIERLQQLGYQASFTAVDATHRPTASMLSVADTLLP